MMKNKPSLLQGLKQRARALKAETYAVYLAARDPRTPWYARALIWFVVAHTFSPIDLIPDFIPILGYLDDLVITPLGLALALRLIPPMVLAEARVKADQAGEWNRTAGWVGAAIIVLIWTIFLVWAINIILSFRQ